MPCGVVLWCILSTILGLSVNFIQEIESFYLLSNLHMQNTARDLSIIADCVNADRLTEINRKINANNYQ